MSSSVFIPVGRTSLVKKGTAGLQIQTEYAYRPYPRITTTVSTNGQVLHKIEKKLKRAVESIEEQRKMEEVIRRQHGEVSAIIEQETFVAALGLKARLEMQWQELSAFDRLAAIPGVERIYRLNTKGEFLDTTTGPEFRILFEPIFKNLRDIIEVFTQLSGDPLTREKGVYEVELDRLYLVSIGTECLFVVVRPIGSGVDFEKEITKIISG